MNLAAHCLASAHEKRDGMPYLACKGDNAVDEISMHDVAKSQSPTHRCLFITPIPLPNPFPPKPVLPPPITPLPAIPGRRWLELTAVKLDDADAPTCEGCELTRPAGLMPQEGTTRLNRPLIIKNRLSTQTTRIKLLGDTKLVLNKLCLSIAMTFRSIV